MIADLDRLTVSSNNCVHSNRDFDKILSRSLLETTITVHDIISCKNTYYVHVKKAQPSKVETCLKVTACVDTSHLM